MMFEEGSDREAGLAFDDEEDVPEHPRRPRVSERTRRARARRRRLVVLLSIVLVIAMVGFGFVVLRGYVQDRFGTDDYSGAGFGEVTVEVRSGDTSADIGKTLLDSGVVKSVKAFTDAASKDDRSLGIQPGVYKVRKEMSGKAALDLLLDQSSRQVNRLTLPEGLLAREIVTKLAAQLGAPPADVQKVVDDVANLGIPAGFGTPRSAEGFLYPTTYEIDPGTDARTAVQQMVEAFTSVDREVGLSAGAPALKLSAYQVLIVASMVEAEARFPEDRAKVARVIYNRLAKEMALGIDGADQYPLKAAGKDVRGVDYEDTSNPYNTRRKLGLPPTPISNPGKDALNAAVHPEPGPWLYYVNKDKEGHLFFTADPAEFQRAADACRANGWGCTT